METKPLTALVLAAGEGSRLRPLTQDRPKPMIEIAGAPILAHNIRLLVKHGVTDIIVNVHYRPDVIQNFLGTGAAFGARITYSYEPELLGTAGAAKHVEERLSDPFFVLYGDNVSTCNLTRLREFHQVQEAALTMAVFHREDTGASGVVELDARDRVVRFVEKPAPGETSSSWVNAGILLCAKDTLAIVPAHAFCDYGATALPALLQAGSNIYAYRMSEHLWWIDSLADYERTLASAPAILLEES